MLIDNFRTPALEHHLPVQCVVQGPSQGLHRLPLPPGHMNLSLHQIEDEVRMKSSGGGC